MSSLTKTDNFMSFELSMYIGILCKEKKHARSGVFLLFPFKNCQIDNRVRARFIMLMVCVHAKRSNYKKSLQSMFGTFHDISHI